LKRFNHFTTSVSYFYKYMGLIKTWDCVDVYRGAGPPLMNLFLGAAIARILIEFLLQILKPLDDLLHVRAFCR